MALTQQNPQTELEVALEIMSHFEVGNRSEAFTKMLDAATTAKYLSQNINDLADSLMEDNGGRSHAETVRGEIAKLRVHTEQILEHLIDAQSRLTAVSNTNIMAAMAIKSSSVVHNLSREDEVMFYSTHFEEYCSIVDKDATRLMKRERGL